MEKTLQILNFCSSKKSLALFATWHINKSILIMLLFSFASMTAVHAQFTAFPDSGFAKVGSKWYYENNAKDKDVIKNIFVESVKDTLITYLAGNVDSTSYTVKA